MQWRTGQVVSLPDGKWAPLDIRQYGHQAVCVWEREVKIQPWALLHLYQYPASVCWYDIADIWYSFLVYTVHKPGMELLQYLLNLRMISVRSYPLAEAHRAK